MVYQGPNGVHKRKVVVVPLQKEKSLQILEVSGIFAGG